jgi:hypothetical protein
MMKAFDRRALVAANMGAIAIAAAFFYWSSAVQPLYPFGGTEIDDRTPLFQWTGNAAGYVLLIDEDPSFSSPLSFTAKDTSYEVPEMDFGTYWWKVESGASETAPMSFSIVSSVALSRPVKDTITNAGNTELSIEGDAMTGAVTLAVNESIEVQEDENVRAEQK